MRIPIFLLLGSLAVATGALPAAAQKFQPKTIQFKGDPEYTDEELMTAAGLKKGVTLTSAEMNDHARQLMDSGVFAGLSYKFDGQDLVYSITPTPDDQLYPIRLENLPLAAGPDLEAILRRRIPLYHGKVPPEGGLLESVRAALATMLAAEGIKATITTVPFGTPGTRKVSAMNFSITAPPVRVGALDVQRVSPAVAAKVKWVTDHAAGVPFDTANSAANLEHAYTSFYADEGYAAVKVHAVRSGDPVVSDAAVDVPFTITVDEGRLYKLGAIHLPPDALMTQAEIEKLEAGQSAVAKGFALRFIWAAIAARYKSKGYLDFTMTQQPELDDAAGVANYTVDLKPGPVYHLALLRFDNVSDDLRKLLMRNWQMFPGDPFDESYVANFIARAQAADPVLLRTLAGVKASYDVRADPVSHDVNVVMRLERR